MVTRTNLEMLHEAFTDAFNTYMDLIQALPLYRTVEQEEQLTAARMECDRARWRWKTAEYWDKRDRAA